MNKLSAAEARKIDMVDYLFSLGFRAIKTRGQDYWYFSPFRNERTPSFKINRKSNIWFDHGAGEGGNIIDFGVLYHGLKVGEFLQLLAKNLGQHDFSFHPPLKERDIDLSAGEKENISQNKIIVTDTRQLSNIRLLHYLDSRAISPELASQYCQEVDFSLHKKQHTAIGFPNGKGGYELRNAYFKGSSSPKTSRFFNNCATALHVFEGFFDFLSWLSHFQKDQPGEHNFLVLNSLSFFEKSRSLMEQHDKISLFLDQGASGRLSTQKALTWNKEIKSVKYTDSSDLYKQHDDLNAWLVAQADRREQQKIKRGRGI